jgi:Zn-finger nucleic acid-binding protein
LRRFIYEGAPLDECPACRGCYVGLDQLTRIFSRREYAFSDEIKRLAAALPPVGMRSRITRLYQEPALDRRGLAHWTCPACRSGMVRKFYNPAYWVEVEQCWVCGLAWLDKDELELLQYLFESQPRARDM